MVDLGLPRPIDPATLQRSTTITTRLQSVHYTLSRLRPTTGKTLRTLLARSSVPRVRLLGRRFVARYPRPSALRGDSLLQFSNTSLELVDDRLLLGNDRQQSLPALSTQVCCTLLTSFLLQSRADLLEIWGSRLALNLSTLNNSVPDDMNHWEANWNKHPTACTCVGCENRRLGRGWLGQNRPPQSAMKTYNLSPSEKKHLTEAVTSRADNPRPTNTRDSGVAGLFIALSILIVIGLAAIFVFMFLG